MKISEIKRRAISKLDGDPFSDKFIFFAFLVRCAMTLLCIYSIIVSYIVLGRMDFSNIFFYVIFCLLMIFEIVIAVLYNFSMNKKILSNSNGDFNFDIKEVFYYLKTRGALLGALSVVLVQGLLILLWAIGLLIVVAFIAFVMGIFLPNTMNALIFAIIMAYICFIVLMIYVVLSYSMAPFIKIENPNKKVFDCIKESKLIMRGNVFKSFLLILSFIGWVILSLLSFGLLIPFVSTYFNASFVEFYKSIKIYNNSFEEDQVNQNDDETYHSDYNLDIQSNSRSKYKNVFLTLIIVQTIVAFLGMNYLSNKKLIDSYISTGKVQVDENVLEINDELLYKMGIEGEYREYVKSILNAFGGLNIGIY